MRIQDEYFEWIYQKVEGKKYRDLLETIHSIPFYYIIPMDDNRLIDGVCTRYRFASEVGIPDFVIDKKFDKNVCSVLEVMIGLSFRIEDTIMADADFGDRTSMWFWMMVRSLGLYEQTNNNYDDSYVREVIRKLLAREYEPSGAGSLFLVNDETKDMRVYEIWYQMSLFFGKLL